MGVISFITLCDYLGTFAFAISGIRLASAKRFDWFGAYVVGLATAVGGGTIRDLLLNQAPFWMAQPSYVLVTLFALVFVVIFRRVVIRMDNTVFIFDAIGLGLFVVVGMEKALSLGSPIWVSMIMGTITGSFGGLIRDVFINEVPLIFRKDIYALACLFGCFVYAVLLNYSPLSVGYVQLLSAIAVIFMRVLSVRFNLCLPTLRSDED